jgi:hypothetical protein
MNRTVLLAAFALSSLAGIVISSAAGQTSSHPMHPRPGMMPPAATATAPSTARPPVPSSAYSTIPGKKTAAGEQFFIVASIDLQRSQLLLKYPTEVTLLARTTDQTKFVDDSGSPIKLSDLRTGDTVWLTSAGTADSTTAVKVRKGEMTVADLHRYYLDYSEIK